MSKFFKNLSVRAVCVTMALVLAVSFLVPTGSVFAADAKTSKSDLALVKAYKAEQARLVVQQTNLGKTATRISNVQATITKAQAAGKDTTTLEAALAIYQSEVTTAQDSHTTAASILAAHSGFDDAGLVTDSAAAKLTVNSTHQAIEVCRKILEQAGKDLTRAEKQWRSDVKLTNVDAILKKDITSENNWLGIQQTHLNNTATVVTNIQTLITKATAAGKDTSALSAALATYQSQITTATGSHATAVTILTTHSGFDASNNVTDLAAARLTVTGARQSLEDAHVVLWTASLNLHTAVTQWRQAHK
jgi:hypothetical protein